MILAVKKLGNSHHAPVVGGYKYSLRNNVKKYYSYTYKFDYPGTRSGFPVGFRGFIIDEPHGTSALFKGSY